MRYESEELQDLLAAEFVLGNLRGAARRRLAALMRHHAGLRVKVERWEERLFPLALRAPKVEPPRRVWRLVQARIAPQRPAARWWPRIASAGFACLLAVLVYVGIAPPRPGGFTTVAVLHDAKASPGIVVSWTPRQAAERRLSVRIVAHPDMPPGTSWQAWLMTDRDSTPVALGLVSADEHQVLDLSAAAAEALPRAVVIGVSVEPKGGSPAGRPSGAFLFQGQVLTIDG